MRAAVLFDGTDQLEIVDVEHDDPRGREILVHTHAVGLCHSDYHVMDGTLDRPRPMIPGHEAAGVVLAVGPKVTSLSVGDHVVTCLVMGCRECPSCEAGVPTQCTQPAATKRPPGEPPRLTMNGKPIGVMSNIGGLAERILLDERAVVVVPKDLNFTLAPLFGCAVVTGLGSVLNVANVQRGETVAVIGCGGVGLNVIQGARIAGASRVIAVDRNPDKFDLARRLGATDTIDASAGDAVVALQALVGAGVHHAFEVVGREATVQQALDMAAPGHTAYLLGIFPDTGTVTLPTTAFRRGKSMVGVFMGSTQPLIDIPRYIDMLTARQLDVESMVSSVLTLDQVNDGFAAMARADGARTVIRF
jgi:S-(hydroxymethyl)glutathione dehydrogenase / alcohol dehydrogenase